MVELIYQLMILVLSSALTAGLLDLMPVTLAIHLFNFKVSGDDGLLISWNEFHLSLL